MLFREIEIKQKRLEKKINYKTNIFLYSLSYTNEDINKDCFL